MLGFAIDGNGSPTHVVGWNPVSLEMTKDGKQVEVAVPQPEGTVFPEDFDAVFLAMAGPAEDRRVFTFSESGASTSAVDKDARKFARRRDRLAAILDEGDDSK